MPKASRKPVLLKLSGESFSGQSGFGLDPDRLTSVARELARASRRGIRLGVVVGGGNFIRGAAFTQKTRVVDWATADYMGMISTVLNAIGLQEALEREGRAARVLSAIHVRQVCEPYIRRRALRHLEKGRVVIFAGGTGNPFFTTDTAAALRAVEIGAGILLKATKVDGVYDRDPNKFRQARKFSRLTYAEAISRHLDIMDQTAFTVCREHKIPLRIFNLFHLAAALTGKPVGTMISA
ncbi:UMP kinase [bacterium]|nr:UMP kinase [bacterium]